MDQEKNIFISLTPVRENDTSDNTPKNGLVINPAYLIAI